MGISPRRMHSDLDFASAVASSAHTLHRLIEPLARPYARCISIRLFILLSRYRSPPTSRVTPRYRETSGTGLRDVQGHIVALSSTAQRIRYFSNLSPSRLPRSELASGSRAYKVLRSDLSSDARNREESPLISLSLSSPVDARKPPRTRRVFTRLPISMHEHRIAHPLSSDSARGCIVKVPPPARSANIVITPYRRIFPPLCSCCLLPREHSPFSSRDYFRNALSVCSMQQRGKRG